MTLTPVETLVMMYECGSWSMMQLQLVRMDWLLSEDDTDNCLKTWTHVWICVLVNIAI